EGFSSIYETYGEALKAHIELEYLGAPVKTEALQKHLGTLDPLEETVEFIECFGIDNPHSNAQLSNYIKETYEGIDIPKTEKTGQLQLSGEILEELKDKDKLFQKLHAHRQKTQDYKEHKKLFEAISPITGRVHASCRVLGASSGRTLTSNPNFQGQAKSVRSFIGVPEGSGLRITSADYSQQELRIFSILTRNETFLQILEEGGDGYKGVASTVLNKPMSEISEQERKVFKRVTLALLYGQGTKLLAGQLNKPIEETKKLYGEVKDILGVDVLQRKLKQEHKNGYVPTVFGKSTRKIIDRWQTLREYQLINYAIQGTASNIGILALIKLTKRLKGLGLVFGYIHDEFLVEHSLSEADRVKDVVKTAMEEAFLECFGEAERQRKFLVEVNINTHWEK
ncbi:MAG: hypothetical protein KDK69_06100, partial [Chlamydiia bacterium]|nr:hypothetical protein [Chlamydiia bacterium]